MHPPPKRITRRRMMRRSCQSAAAGFVSLEAVRPLLAAAANRFADGKRRHFKIGACDWSIHKLGQVSALEVAKQLGLDGVQVSLGTRRNEMHLRKPGVQKEYKEAAKAHGVEIASLAIGELNNVPYKSSLEAETWVRDSIDAARALGIRVVLLAFFHKGELKGDKKGVDEVVRRLKKVAPKAEKAGVVLGVESYLDAEEHMDIVRRVGSPSVKVYYDVANSLAKGYDIYKEIRWLGREHICEFHMKENGFLLGDGRVDFRKVRAAIDDIGYGGWLIIEGAVPRGKSMAESYVANREYLRSLFPEKA